MRIRLQLSPGRIHLSDRIKPYVLLRRKKNYYGMMVKREKTLYLGRPEGDQMLKPGEQIEGAGASAKPILLRVACDHCEEEDNGPNCIQACPYGVLSMEGGE